MNQFIVSQWFKYKDDLKLFYENHFPGVDEMQEISYDEGTFGENKDKRTKITWIAPNMKEERIFLNNSDGGLFLDSFNG